MAALSDMRSRIADDINRNDLSTQIDKAINRAITYYQAYRFWFNEAVSTFETVASQEAYGTADNVPSTLLEIDVLQITSSSGDKLILQRRPYEWILAINTDSSTGEPTHYAYYKENIYLYLIPDATYTMTLSYLKSYATLASDASTNDFLDHAEDLIEARATWWIYSRILKDHNNAQYCKAEELEALQALQSKTINLVSTGSLCGSGF